MKRFLLFFSAVLLSYNVDAQGWGQTQKITADDRAIGDQFGWPVNIQGTTIAIGARGADGNSSDYGAVYVYALVNNSWEQTQKLMHSSPRQFDSFGGWLDFDGDNMIVGARGQDYDLNEANFVSAAGAAYFFEKDNAGHWNQSQKVVASDRGVTSIALFGETVAISGDYAVVASPREDTGLNGQSNLNEAGACYIFERDNNGVWNEVQKIVPSQRYAGDRFGDFSLFIDGTTIAVGVFRHDFDVNETNKVPSSGAVYMFERDTNGIWNQTQKLVASDREQGEWFGRSVALDGNTLVIGASQEYLQGNLSAQYGAAYIFERDGSGVWNEVQKIRPNALHHQSKFGHAVDIDGNRMVIGAYAMNVLDVDFGGTAFVFEKDGSGVWDQTAIMYNENVSSFDRFGYSVAIDGDFSVVGAYQEEEDINEQNTLSDSGSAYIFNSNEPNNLNTLNVSEVVSNSKIKLFPNPVESVLNIDFAQAFKVLTIDVHDTLGRQIVSKRYIESSMVQLDVDFPNGIYLIKITTDGKSSSVFKIVKQ